MPRRQAKGNRFDASWERHRGSAPGEAVASSCRRRLRSRISRPPRRRRRGRGNPQSSRRIRRSRRCPPPPSPLRSRQIRLRVRHRRRRPPVTVAGAHVAGRGGLSRRDRPRSDRKPHRGEAAAREPALRSGRVVDRPPPSDRAQARPSDRIGCRHSPRNPHSAISRWFSVLWRRRSSSVVAGPTVC